MRVEDGKPSKPHFAQRPSTANGITFVTLEDETAIANLIVRREVWDQHRKAGRTASIMLATAFDINL